MAKKTKAYDNPAYQARYSAPFRCPAIAASTTVGKFVAFAAMKIKSVRGNVDVAGTNAAAGYDIYNGTTSIGELVAGTNTAGSTLAAILPDATLAENGFIEIKTKANSATLAASLAFEYEITPGAEITA